MSKKYSITIEELPVQGVELDDEQLRATRGGLGGWGWLPLWEACSSLIGGGEDYDGPW